MSFLPSGIPVTQSLTRRWKAEPLSMILDGAYQINTSHGFDKAKGISVDREAFSGPRVFYPQIEQRYILEFRVECKKRGIPSKLVIAKARYCGVSSITAAIIVSEMVFSPVPTCNAVSADPNSKEHVLYGYFASFLKNMPEIFGFTERSFSKFSDRQISYKIPGNSAYGINQSVGQVLIHAATMNEKTAVGTRAPWQWITEFSKMKNDEDVMRTLGETVMDTQNAFVLMESTCEGQDNYHFAMFDAAWKAQGSVNFYHPAFNWDGIKRAGSFAMFFPAYMNPRRYMDFKNPHHAELLLADLTDKEQHYMRVMKEYFRTQHILYNVPPPPSAKEYIRQLSLKFILWLRAYSVGIPSVTKDWTWWPDFHDKDIIKQTLPKSLVMRHKEVPVTVEEAFDTSVEVVFNTELITFYKEQSQSLSLSRPPMVGYLTEEGRFVEDKSGWIEVYFAPYEIYSNEGYAPSRVYFIGGDFAHGDSPSNDCSDFSTLVAVDMRQQILTVEVKDTVPVFERKIDRVLRFLSRNFQNENLVPFTCLESADAGRRTVQHYNENQDAFPNPDRLYFSERVDQNGQPHMPRPGFDPSIRKLDIDAWKSFEYDIESKSTILYSMPMIDQMKTLIRDSDGRLKAPRKGRGGIASKDDIVDALKLALWYRKRILEVSNGDITLEVLNCDINGNIKIESEDFHEKAKRISYFDRAIRNK